MVNRGDIIVIENYLDHNNDMGRHSFIVLNNEQGMISGFNYDIVCNVMSSFKDVKQKNK